ncbi:MAG: hypothetical protein P8L78_03580 [Mariniblastus sp.]|nr:hypothetical protein [Mariniblastus sp.]
MQFENHIGIDYSGAATPRTRSATIQAYQSRASEAPTHVASPASTDNRKRNWNRLELFDWIVSQFEQSNPTIIGIDHGLSFPISYFNRYQLTSWDDFLNDFATHWPTDHPEATVEQFRETSSRIGTNDEMRISENWTSSAKSVFQFDVQGSVAKSTHAGLPFIYRLRKAVPKVHFWPFDGWKIPAGTSVLTEIYPSIFRNRFPRQARTVDQQDAYSVCRWLNEMDQAKQLPTFFNPPIDPSTKRSAAKEGWILGVY